MPKLLNIAIPTYNRVQQLEYGLKKFVSQIENKFENFIDIFISDDCSTDNTENIIKKYTKQYDFMRYRKYDKNIGLEKNLIECTRWCDGKYLWIFGDDDFLEDDNAIDIIVNLLKSNKYEFFILNRARRSFDLSTLITNNWMKVDVDKDNLYSGLLEFCKEWGIISIIGFISVNIFKRKQFHSIDDKFYYGIMYPQLGMMLEAFCSSSCYFIAKPLICHRTQTLEEKKSSLGDKETEKDFMSDYKLRDSKYFSFRLIRFLMYLIERNALTYSDIDYIKEYVFSNILLKDFVLNNIESYVDHGSEITEDDKDVALKLFEKLTLTANQRKKLRNTLSRTIDDISNGPSKLSISVITPSFNQAQFLGDCINSVYRQTYKPMEHLVFDPGSTDGSREIASRYPHVTLIAEEDQGQSDAINKGFSKAKGDIIAWINSDDCYYDGKVFQQVIDRFRQPDSPDIVYGKGIYIDEKQKKLRDVYVNKKPETLPWRLHQEDGILQPALFMKRKVIDQIGLLSMTLHYCMDYEYWIRCVKAGIKIVYLDINLAMARYHIKNKTYGSRGHSYREVCDMLLKQFGYVNHIWLKRYAEFLVEGFDGVLKHSLNTQIKNKDLAENSYKELLTQYNKNDSVINFLKLRSHEKGYSDTYNEMTTKGIISLDEKNPSGTLSIIEDNSKQNTFHCHIKENKTTIVILGNGPSLTGFDFNKLCGFNTLGMNAAYRYWDKINWYPSYYVCLDDVVLQSHHKQIKRLIDENRIKKFFLRAQFYDYYPQLIDDDRVVVLDEFIEGLNKKYKLKYNLKFTIHPIFKTKNLNKLTTGAYSVRFAKYMGYTRVLLLGIDLNYINYIKESKHVNDLKLEIIRTPRKNPNYFFEEYQKAGDLYQVPNPDCHNGNLHLQAFEVLKDDFSTNNIKCKIINCNKSSRLFDHNIFPYGDLDQVLHEKILDGLVIPTTEKEVDSLLNNIRLWDNWELLPFADIPEKPICDIIYVFNEIQKKDIETEIMSIFNSTQRLRKCFKDIKFFYANLTKVQDIYSLDFLNRPLDYIKKGSPKNGYIAGPNNLFFYMIHCLKDYHYILQMENDCIAIRNNWLGRAAELVASYPQNFWIMGSIYRGNSGLDRKYKTHINGNSIMAVGNPEFRNFVLKNFRHYLEKYIEEVDSTLAFDTAMDVFFHDFDGNWNFIQNNFHKFVYTEFIQNYGGASHITGGDRHNVEDLKQKYPETYILHGKLLTKKRSSFSKKEKKKNFKAKHDNPQQTSSPEHQFPFLYDDTDKFFKNFQREEHAQFDENRIVYEMLLDKTSDKIMIDVGAHHGSALLPFAQDNWRIFAFEPDPTNRETLLKKIKNLSLVSVDNRAVSDKIIDLVPFYSSKESTGISCLTPFRDSHQEVCQVSATTLSAFCKDKEITSVEFLKIDVEGYDLMVLKGFPWESFKPNVILCEFEDSKTIPLGYDFHEMARFLVDKGYMVLVSEWHPIIRYGIPHDWCRLVTYPCELSTSDAWGNLIAFREKPDIRKVAEIANKLINLRQKDPIDKDLSVKNEQKKQKMNQNKPNVSMNSQSTSLNKTESIKKPFIKRHYRRFANYIVGHYPAIGRIGLFGVWSIRALKRRIFGLGGLTFLLIGGSFAAAYFFKDYRWVFILGGGGMVLFLVGVLGVAYARYIFRSFRDIQRNEAQLQARQAINDSQTKLETRFKAEVQKMHKELNQVVKESSQQAKDELQRLSKQLGKKVDGLAIMLTQNEGRFEEGGQQVRQELSRAIEKSGQQANKELQDLREQSGKKIENLANGLKQNKVRSEAVFQQMHETLGEFEKNSEQFVKRQITQINENYVNVEKTLENLRKDSQRSIQESKEALNTHLEITKKSSFLNAGIYQPFNRHLQDDHIQRLLKFWLPTLTLENLDRQALGYLAHRICQIENNCSGRLAATIQDAVLRTLIAQSIRSKKLEMLEIGSLFGIGLAIIYDNCRGRFDRIHLTTIDPLEGYYDKSTYDISTKAPINRTLFEHNLRIADIPKKNVSLIQALSTDKKAQEAAAKRSYSILIIDGDHSYDGVKFDFENYHQMVKRGGYIIFDDYNCKEWPDVTKFVDSEVKTKTELKLVGNDWRTVVFKVLKKQNIAKEAPK